MGTITDLIRVRGAWGHWYIIYHGQHLDEMTPMLNDLQYRFTCILHIFFNFIYSHNIVIGI